MAHLGSSYTAAADFVGLADATFRADLAALNSSGVSGTIIASYILDGDGGYVNIAVLAEGLVSGDHIQHVHGTFDGEGNPTDAQSPTIFSDADGDGMVEVLEGVPSYGDILLNVDNPDGSQPSADMDGQLAYVQSFDIEEAENFFSPVTETQYDFADMMDLALREYVIHGMSIPDGIGTGTEGEVNGTGGFIPILPAASGEFRAVTADAALAAIADAREGASKLTRLDNDANTFDGGLGDDRIFGFQGDDVLNGGGDDDRVIGQRGNDSLNGGDGADWIRGGIGRDLLFGDAGDDEIYGMLGADLLVGGDGDDFLVGGRGRDIFGGLAGDDIVSGGVGRDEFHFDAGTGTDTIVDFEIGVDVISLLDDGAVSFANSDEDATRRGDSDLSADDFDMVGNLAGLDADNDQQVVYSSGGTAELMDGTGAAVEAYVAATDGTDTVLAYDDDWSTAEGRELIATLTGVSTALTVNEFDVY